MGFNLEDFVTVLVAETNLTDRYGSDVCLYTFVSVAFVFVGILLLVQFDLVFEIGLFGFEMCLCLKVN